MKCINCYREIDEHLKFCTYCGAKQPLDRAAYEREHPELANALSEEEQQELERQRQIEEAERQRIEAERLAQEEAERKAREEALAQSQVAQQYPKYQENSLGNQPPSSSGYDRGYNPNYEQQPQQGSTTFSNLIGCPECGRLISPRAASCPHCGNPMRAPIAEQGGFAGTGVGTSANASVGYNPPKEKDNSKVALTILVVALIAAIALLGGYIIYQNKGANSGTELSEINALDSVEAATNTPIAGQQVAGEPNRTSGEEQPNALSYHHPDRPIDCYSENINGYSTHASQSNGTPFEDKSVYINDAWLEHEVEEGIKIHVSMKATNLRGCSVRVVCLFYFDDGRQINDTDGLYKTSSGQVCTSVNVTPSYDESTWQDLQLWIPYTQIKSKHDWKHLKCRLKVYNDGHCLATSDYMHFGCELI